MPKKQEEKEMNNLKAMPFGEAEENQSDDILASWEFPEHETIERGKWWYLIFIILIIGCLVYSYYDRNPMFVVILTGFIILYFVIERREPLLVRATLTPTGIFINNKFLEYQSFENFYIIYQPPQTKNLYLQPKAGLKSVLLLQSVILLPLMDENPIAIREILLKFLPEDLSKEEIPATDGISRLLKL